MVEYYAGFDIGGTRIKAIAVSPEGRRLADAEALTQDGEVVQGEPAFAVECRTILKQWEADFGVSAAAAGVAAPGVAAKDDHAMIFMVGRMQQVVGFDFRKALGSLLPVPVLNDAHAALVGEAWIGAARGMVDVALLTLGTGVGGAMLVDGRLVKGHFGRAGHFGHACLDLHGAPGIFGTPGVFEDFIGNFGIVHRTDGRFTDTKELLEAVRNGDTEAAKMWGKSLHALACGIATIGNMLDPEAIIVGGGIAEAGPILWDGLEKALDRVEWRPNGHRLRLIRPELADWAGAFGAARRAMTQRQP